MKFFDSIEFNDGRLLIIITPDKVLKRSDRFLKKILLIRAVYFIRKLFVTFYKNRF